MLALVLAILFCVAIGIGIVGYVLLEARREGRGEFWTPEGEELIAGARRTTEKVRTRGEQLGRSAAGRTRDLAARLPELAAERRARQDGEHVLEDGLDSGTPRRTGDAPQPTTDGEGDPPGTEAREPGYRAAS